MAGVFRFQGRSLLFVSTRELPLFRVPSSLVVQVQSKEILRTVNGQLRSVCSEDADAAEHPEALPVAVRTAS